MEERAGVDSDEAYVSGNLSSGSFPSIGPVKDTPSSLSAPLNTDAGGERRKFTSKGQDGAIQLSGRRKGGHSGRRGVGGYPEVALGMSGSGSSSRAHVHSGSLSTPTTILSRQINQMDLMSPLVSGGKRTLAERADDMSPMSDTEGGTHSLNDPGYGSLPHGPTSLEQPNSLSKERGQSGSGTSGTMDQTKDIPVPPKPAGMCVCVSSNAVSVNAVVVRRCGALELRMSP